MLRNKLYQELFLSTLINLCGCLKNQRIYLQLFYQPTNPISINLSSNFQLSTKPINQNQLYPSQPIRIVLFCKSTNHLLAHRKSTNQNSRQPISIKQKINPEKIEGNMLREKIISLVENNPSKAAQIIHEMIHSQESDKSIA